MTIFDYLGKPVHLPQLLVVLRRVLAHRVLQKEARSLRSALAARDDGLGGVVGQAKVLRDLLDGPRLFATDAGARLWEEAARANATAEISRLDA